LTCFCPGADAASSPHGKDTLQSMVVSANARLLTKMGRVYIYSKQRISKGMFDDDEFDFGYLPKMATTSKGSIGSLLASSFCERINSQANQVYISP